MRICFLCNEYPPARHGGVGTFVKTLAAELVRRRHTVFVVGPYPKQMHFENNEVRVEKVKLAPFGRAGVPLRAMRIRRKLRNLMETEGIDVVEANDEMAKFLPFSLPVSTVVRLHGGHSFYSHHLGHKVRWVRAWLERRAYRCSDNIVAVSEFVADSTCELLKLDRDRVTVIPNPVDTDRFVPVAAKINSGQLVFIGTIKRHKGVYELVRAMPQIIRGHPGARLSIIGKDQLDEVSHKSNVYNLKQLVPKQVLDRIDFVGTVPHLAVPTYLQGASVVVLPSRMEAMPLAWLEAMSCGKAVVASKTGPGPEVIENGKSGLLCDPFDPKDIAEKVLMVLKDRVFAERMGRNARRRVEKHFSPDVLVPKNIEFYEECIKRFRKDQSERRKGIGGF